MRRLALPLLRAVACRRMVTVFRLSRVSINDERESSSPPRGLFSPRFLWVTLGICLLVAVDAFETLAVTTIMPAVSKQLDGSTLYAFAFAAPIALSLVGMVVAGFASDRGSVVAVLMISVGVFMVGSLAAGVAQTMEFFVAARLVHVCAGGALAVVLYVVIARVYPAELHSRIFAATAAAWVLPSLVGPFISGLAAQTVGWRWVFVGSVVLTGVAVLLVLPALRVVRAGGGPSPEHPRSLWPLLWAMLLASGILALSAAAESQGVARWGVVAVASIVTVVAVRPLVPRGTLRAVRGLPSVIMIRAVTAGGFSAAEVYVPLMLVTFYGESPAQAGFALTAGGLTWAGAAWVQGKFPRMSDRLTAVCASIFMGIAMLSLMCAAVVTVPVVVIMVGWSFAGAGMGIVSPRLGSATLAHSTTFNQGFNSSALNIAYSAGAALVLALTALVSSVFGGTTGRGGFLAIFVTTGILCVVSLWLAPRIGEVSELLNGVDTELSQNANA